MVFYFSGTGNSLRVAKTLAKELGDGEVVSMTEPFDAAKKYDTIGLVYPTYFWGLPKKVIEFIANSNFDHNRDAYFYSIATYGGSAGNAVYQLYALLLDRHGIKLQYGTTLRMFSNYVVIYDMSKKVDEITRRSNERLVPIIDAIRMRKNNRVSKLTGIFKFINDDFIKKAAGMDKNFRVNSDCTGCGICQKVCPVKNIEMVNHRPQYNHHCEQCVACIQYCPQRAINYKDATRGRGRYTNPEITYQELSEYNHRRRRPGAAD
jgi:ferredoxin/flavodoxin